MPKLKLMRSVELHFHLLPGVDDGPADLDDSLALARAAVADGSGAVIVTPHVRSGCVERVLELPERVRELRAALLSSHVDLELTCGGELDHDMVWRLSQRELETIAQGPRGARWMLVETPFEPLGEDFHAATDELRQRGFGIVLAHPERSADVLLGGGGLSRELQCGALAQVTAGSLLGRHGPEPQRAAWELVAEPELPLLVSSDAHGPTRPPALTPSLEALSEGLGDELRARQLVFGVPRRLVARGVERHQRAAA